MRALSLLGGALGLGTIAGLVFYSGAVPVARSLWAVGIIGLAAICAIHLSLFVAMGLAWQVLLPATRASAVIWARLVRDSASEVLPLSQVGGYVLGARALVVAGVSGAEAAASTIVDITVEFFAQLAYTALALWWLVQIDPHSRAAWPAAIGLTVACGLAGGFLMVQLRGFAVFDRLARQLARGWAWQTANGAAALHFAIAKIYARPRRLWVSFVLHLGCWLAAAGEIWLALRMIGQPRGLGMVLVMESLLYAVRSVAFAVPNAFGVQEGAYIMLGAGFGLPPDVALALSLLKRARDFAIGAPVLAIYQLVESDQIWRSAGANIQPYPVAVEMKPRP